MGRLKSLNRRWEYWSEIINGRKVQFRRNVETKDFYVEATDNFAQAMGHESLAMMLGNNLNMLNTIYGEYSKWLWIEWADDRNGCIRMGLRIVASTIYSVSAKQ